VATIIAFPKPAETAPKVENFATFAPEIIVFPNTGLATLSRLWRAQVMRDARPADASREGRLPR
jgi:hypothetical protein